jgi:arylsulfatase A-like enzyme
MAVQDPRIPNSIVTTRRGAFNATIPQDSPRPTDLVVQMNIQQPPTDDAPPRETSPERLSPLSLLALSAWCGVVAGWAEVVTIVVRNRAFKSNKIYQMSPDFVWLVPMTNLLVFLALAIVVCLAGRIRPRHTTWLTVRLLCCLTLLPMLLTAFPQIYGLAWLILTSGVAAWLAPVLERNSAIFRRLIRTTFPVVAGLVPVLAGLPRVGDWLKAREETTRPLPSPGSPNVLLIVMDTVAADHLSVYRYERPTCPTLVELARRGTCFTAAQAASSWTLPSHASMFTGRWPHELSVGWYTPLDAAYPTLAQYLRTQGYATAGFVANAAYCAEESGLGRGFTEYQDYALPALSPFKTAALVNRTLAEMKSVAAFLDEKWGFTAPRTYVVRITNWFNQDRKEAATVNRQFLDWLSSRRRPERPFFAFLNYFDAHDPYQLPLGRIHRFSSPPTNAHDGRLIEDWPYINKTGLLAQEKAYAVNAYDDCIAALDEQLGRLVDELERRGALEKTWLIITADHGESFGEHPGVYGHGTSLYQTELHVPLLIVPPGGRRSQQNIDETVSLRDLAATVVDLVGFSSGSPFPGKSLARFWGPSAPLIADPADHALAEVVPPGNFDPGSTSSPTPRWPLGALAEHGWAYIRREGGASEELFHLDVDAKQEHNLAEDPAERNRLEQMRKVLSQLSAGPLTPERFNP